MVLHQQRQRLVCHHCGSERPALAQCPDCQSELVPLGQGTERLEQKLAELFPDYPLARIDRDTTRRSGELERLLDTVHSEQSRILLGTQMLTKGHHFPGVTLVAIIDSDQGLFGTDFRSSERLAQAIVQVAGRAGRAERAGEVWIQTFYPDHPLLQTLLTEGYGSFARKALDERRAAGWPPFSHLVLLRSECAERDRLFQFLEQARECTNGIVTPAGASQLRILGPATAPMERRSGRYRGQLLIQSIQRNELQRFLPAWRNRLGALADARRVRWSLDVDPIELF
jgi:primosomal protein N' (replication factor Y)